MAMDNYTVSRFLLKGVIFLIWIALAGHITVVHCILCTHLCSYKNHIRRRYDSRMHMRHA